MAVLFVFSCLYICESPKFYYTKGRYQESREALMYIAWFNGCNGFDVNFKFDTEVLKEE